MNNKAVGLTGLGVLSPIGLTPEEYWSSLMEGKSGIRALESLRSEDGSWVPYGGEVGDFRPKDYLPPPRRKGIKMMSRDIQMAFVAVELALRHSGHCTKDGANTANDLAAADGQSVRTVDPDRLGVLYGCDLIGLDLSELTSAFRAGKTENEYDFGTWGKAAMSNILPLWMLKYLPNMPACHIGLINDARGPSNTLTMDRGSSLAAMMEAARIIARGSADVMICGGCGNRINPTVLSRGTAYGLAPFSENPNSVPRPFDKNRIGTAVGEGSAAFILESEEFAIARGAKPLAKILGFSCAVQQEVKIGTSKSAVQMSLRQTLKNADRCPEDVGHINADGLGTVQEDNAEAEAIREEMGETPVIALKGAFGNLGSGTGAVELVGSLLSLEKGVLPPTMNCREIADDCPINVVKDRPLEGTKPSFIALNQTNMGRSYSMMFEKY